MSITDGSGSGGTAANPRTHADLRAAIMALIQADFHVYPAGSGKGPSNDGAFYGATTDPEQVDAWLAERRFKNVYIATGSFTGVVVIDADSPEAYEWMRKHYGEPHVKTKRGGHWYFCHPRDGKVKSVSKYDPLKLLDCKGDGGGVVVPPSAGKEWTNGVPVRDELPILPDELRPPNKPAPSDAGKKLPEDRMSALVDAITAKYAPPGQQYDWGLHLAGVLLRRGISQEDAYNVMLEACQRASTPDKDTERNIERVVITTAERLANDETTTGGPELQKITPGLLTEIDRILAPVRIEGYDFSRNGQPQRRNDNNDNNSSEPKRNQADRLIQYALDSGAPLFRDHLGQPHALVSPTQAVPLNSRAYNCLRSLIWDYEQRSPTAESLKTAVGMLAAFAETSGDVRTLYTRAAFYDGRLYYWLGPERIVEVDARGWRVRESVPVLFRTIPNLRELPNPSARGSFDALDALLNLKSERDKRLFRAYMVTLPLEQIPRPILQPTGVMGSGKTTACRAIKRALDPAAPESVRIDPRDFLQKASHSYIVMLDNQNSLPEWAVDMLCRLVTGEADSKRRHYTDDDDFIYELKRAVLLNGINAPTDRGDAQDRTLPVELERISDKVRRNEESLWSEFEAALPQILGALFDTLSATLHARPRVKLSKRPRLADWGYYAAAVYEVSGWGSAQFLADWASVVKSQNQETLEGSALAQCILAIMEEHNEFKASTSRLLEVLETEAEKLKINIKRDKSWPKSPSWLWRRIREILPLLNAREVYVEKNHTKTGNEIELRTGDGIFGYAVTGDGIKGDAVTDAVTAKAAKVSQKAENGVESDGSDGISGVSSPPLTQEKKEGKQASFAGESDTPRGLPTNAVTAVTAATEPECPPHRAYSFDGNQEMRCKACGIRYEDGLAQEKAERSVMHEDD